MKTSPIINAILLSSLLAPAAFAKEFKKREIKLEKAPEQVQAAVKQHSGGGTVDEVDQVSLDGKTIYIVEIDLPGNRDLDLYLTDTGEVTKRVEEIALEDAPAAVQQAINAKTAAGGELDDDIDKVTVGDMITYEAEIDRTGPDLDLVISADGAIISETETP